MATDVIDYISKKLVQNHIRFTSKITTNGFNLTKEIVERAIKYWHTNKIQVTIDGLFEEYNRIKITKYRWY